MSHWSKEDSEGPRHGIRVRNPLGSLKLLLRKDNTVLVLAWGLVYTIYACNIATSATLLIDIYGLSEWQAGLSYLPFALGGTSSTFFSGWLLDRTYRIARTKRGLSTDKVRGDDLDSFPIEKARLNVMWAPTAVIALCVVSYGWALQHRQHLAAPLTLQFIVGLALQLNFTAFNTLLVDINHRKPSAANASTSVVRCAFAALAVAYIEDLIQAIGVAWTFTSLGFLCSLVLGLLPVEYSKGMSWRQSAHNTNTA
ncbi:major facilitator superfamily domain-containing protein [Pseudomassariella vexata]|uniref:Major facilitator superfamily domain-containing protein n=1 Tax=Pseudomassariella vexata TaxID=1141098 RepID=A0A1Y2E3P6_9PEZI|nr:major facilitator superfamily domain-containing protein [Pseudomassariella vexata]ORY66171.1 major facilitator superfamily domain-containing protein [Pseudomassariella vexata]